MTKKQNLPRLPGTKQIHRPDCAETWAMSMCAKEREPLDGVQRKLVCGLTVCSVIGLLVQFNFLEFTSNGYGRDELMFPNMDNTHEVAPTYPDTENNQTEISTVATEEAVVPTETTEVLSEVEKHCLELSEKEDYRGAVSYLLTRMMENSNDSESAALLPVYQELLKDQVLENAEAYALQGEYRLAILEVLSAQKLYYCDAFENANIAYMARFAMLTDIAVYAGTYHTLGLRADGTVVAAGQTSKGACNVGGWTDIVALSTGDYFSMGLKADGTVVFCGENNDGQDRVSQWTDIIAIGGGKHHAVGMKSDGTIVTSGKGPMGQCET